LVTIDLLSLRGNCPLAPQIYALPLHDALPISISARSRVGEITVTRLCLAEGRALNCLRQLYNLGIEFLGAMRGRSSRPPKMSCRERKSTRLNSSHASSSYAVLCLKKKTTDRPP